jgi:hypothetical protein
MTHTNAELTRRVLFILHRGFVEATNLAYDSRHAQIADLADAMELIPRLIPRLDQEGAVEMLRFVLTNYERQYPTERYDYSKYLDEWPVPDQY